MRFQNGMDFWKEKRLLLLMSAILSHYSLHCHCLHVCLSVCVCVSVCLSISLWHWMHSPLSLIWRLLGLLSASVIFCISNFSRAFHVFIAFISFASFLLFIYLCLYAAYTYLLTDRPPPPIPLGRPHSAWVCLASLRFGFVWIHFIPCLLLPVRLTSALKSGAWHNPEKPSAILMGI